MVAATVSTAIALFASYALSRGGFRHKRLIMLITLFLTALPLPALVLPLYQLYNWLGWLNSRFLTGLVIGASTAPFCLWLLVGSMDSIPLSLDEAASIDGATVFHTIRRVIFPLVFPGVAVALIFSFLQGWSSFLLPLVLDSNPAHVPAAVALDNYLGVHASISIGTLGAFAMIYSVPVLLLYFLVAKQFGGGFNLSGAVRS
ncbi:MAG: carbohydrate ABC transporter permease [Acidimicrobiales bacterium]